MRGGLTRFHFGLPIKSMRPRSLSYKALAFYFGFTKPTGLSRGLGLDSVASNGYVFVHFSATYILQFVGGCCG